MDLKLLCFLSLLATDVLSISLQGKGGLFGGLSGNSDRRANLQGQFRKFKTKWLVPPENEDDENDKKLSEENIEVHHVPVKVIEPPVPNLLQDVSQPIPPLVVAEIDKQSVAEVDNPQKDSPNKDSQPIPHLEVVEIVEEPDAEAYNPEEGRPLADFQPIPPLEVAEIVELDPNEEFEQITPIEVVDIVEQPGGEENNHKGTKPDEELDPIILIKDTNPLPPLELPGVENSDKLEDFKKFSEVIETPVIVSPNLSWNPEIPVGDSILAKKRQRPEVVEIIEVPETPIIVNPNHGWNPVIPVGGSLQDKNRRRPQVEIIEFPDTPVIFSPNHGWSPFIPGGGSLQDKKGRRPEVEIIEVQDTPVIVNPIHGWNPDISIGGSLQDKKRRRPEVEIIEVPDTPVIVDPNYGWDPYEGNFNPYQFFSPFHQDWSPSYEVWEYRNPFSYPRPNQSWQPVFPKQQLQDLRNRIASIHQAQNAPEQPVPGDTKPVPPAPKNPPVPNSATPAPQPPIPVFEIPNNIPKIPEMPAEDVKGDLNSGLNPGLDPGPYPYPEHQNPVVIIPQQPPYQKQPNIKIYNNEHPGQRPVPKETGHKPVPENQDNNVITIMEKRIGMDWLGIVVILVCTIIFIMVICLVCCLCYKRHKSKEASLESILISSDATNITGRSKRYSKSNKQIYKLLPTPSGSSTEQSSDEEVYEKESPRKKRIREQISRETQHAKITGSLKAPDSEGCLEGLLVRYISVNGQQISYYTLPKNIEPG